MACLLLVGGERQGPGNVLENSLARRFRTLCLHYDERGDMYGEIGDPREIQRAKPTGFPDGSGYFSLYIST